MRQLTLDMYASFLQAQEKYRLTDDEKKMARDYGVAIKSKADRPISEARRNCELHRKAYNKQRDYRRCNTFERFLSERDRQTTKANKQKQKRNDWVTPTAIANEVDETKAYWMKRLSRIQRRTYNCSLTVEDLITLHENTPVCPVFGTPLLLDKDTQVDQIKPGEGYHIGNVQLLSALANRIKTNATPEQLMAVAVFMSRQ